jgi:hypothetical protein
VVFRVDTGLARDRLPEAESRRYGMHLVAALVAARVTAPLRVTIDHVIARALRQAMQSR